MNILIIIPQLPYPIFKNGICSTIGNMIPYWSKENTITFIYFDNRDIEAEKIFEKYNVKCYHLNILGKEYIYKYNGKNIIKPRNSWGYCFNNSKNIDISKYDIVLFSSFVSSFLISSVINRNKNQKIIFFEADAMSLFYKRSMEKSKNMINKIYYLVQMKIIKMFENIFYRYSDKTIFVSDIDKNYITTTTDNTLCNKFINTHIGVNINKKRLSDFSNTKNHINLCFSGLMDYQPNKEAVEYIFDHIIPKLVDEDISFTFHIIGNKPQQDWYQNRFVKMKKVIITGFVDDIDEYLSNMDIYVSPLFLGTGMKNKILQAMAIGLPIICSKVSAEGINELIHNKNALLCDEQTESWISSIKKLSQSIELMKKFSEENNRIIKEEYTWEKTAKEILYTT